MKTAASSTVAITMGRFSSTAACAARRPSPCSPNTFSVMIVPLSAVPMSSPAIVTIGVIAARSAWRS